MADQKSRHGCLTAWLVFMIIANSATALFYLLIDSESIKQAYPNAPNWALPLLVIVGLVNLVCSIALFRWKKWGFWGFCLSSIVAFITNIIIGIGAASIMGLVGIALLYGVLQIGKENKGWPQLE
jgi:hypothetical protein